MAAALCCDCKMTRLRQRWCSIAAEGAEELLIPRDRILGTRYGVVGAKGGHAPACRCRLVTGVVLVDVVPRNAAESQ